MFLAWLAQPFTLCLKGPELSFGYSKKLFETYKNLLDVKIFFWKKSHIGIAISYKQKIFFNFTFEYLKLLLCTLGTIILSHITWRSGKKCFPWLVLVHSLPKYCLEGLTFNSHFKVGSKYHLFLFLKINKIMSQLG